MDILHVVEVSQYYYPYRGGQEAYVRHLSERLVKMGHRVSVLTTTATHDVPDVPGLEVVSCPPLFTLLNNPISMAPLRYRALLKDADILHLHNEHSFLTVLSTAMKWRLRKPVALTLHGQLRFGNAALDRFERAYSKTVGNLVLKAADIVCVNSPDDRHVAIGRGVPRERVLLVSNAIDAQRLARYCSEGTRRELKRLYGFNPDGVLALFVGRLIRRKGIEALLRGFEQATMERRNMTLLIIGDGPLMSRCVMTQLRGPAKGRIRIMSGVDEGTLGEIYQAADMLILPSISEVCPTVVLEALFFGCPVITSDIPGIRDHFAEIATLVPAEDAVSLSNAIVRTASLSAQDRQVLGQRSKELVLRSYEWHTVAEKYSTAFAAMAG